MPNEIQTFEQWIEDSKTAMLAQGWTVAAISEMDWDCWRDYYEYDYFPLAALEEDASFQ